MDAGWELTPKLSTEAVRAHFPAFDAPSLRGWRFFENAGGSYPCEAVVSKLTRFYGETKVQPYAPYPASQTAGAAMDRAYHAFAGYLNVAPDEVVFGPSTTANVYVLAQAFAAGWRRGDEIIVTDQDHEANIGAWRRLSERGIKVREWSANPETGRLEITALERLLSRRTKLVAVTHCSNIVAHPNPIAEIAARTRAANARLVVDGVSSAPHGLPDVEALGADIYLCSLYKIFGPHQGLMAVRRGVMAELANQSHVFNDGSARARLNPAGPDHAQVAASAGVIEYLDALHDLHFSSAEPAERGRRTRRLIQQHETELLYPLLAYLNLAKGVRVLGPSAASERAPTVALDTAKPPQEVAAALATRQIMAGAGDFYAPRILRRLGVDPARGVLRLSFVHYTDAEDIDAVIEALDAAL